MKNISKNFEENKRIYNIWNTPKGNDTEVSDSFPKIFMGNLLYYHIFIFILVFFRFFSFSSKLEIFWRSFT